MSKSFLFLSLLILGLAACSDRVESPLELIKTTTIKDTYDFCMKVNGSKEYCNCEIEELERTFPWQDYMNAVDYLAGEENYIAAVISKHNGNRKKILEELNCYTCYFTIAISVIDASPSPKCVELLK